jgi:hypothetical protein
LIVWETILYFSHYFYKITILNARKTSGKPHFPRKKNYYLKNKKKGNYLLPMNYNALTLFPHEVLTMTLDPIKLLFYNTFLPSVSQRDSQHRDNFFSHFAPTLRGYKCHFSDLKWGQKWEKKLISPLTLVLTPLIGRMRESVIRVSTSSSLNLTFLYNFNKIYRKSSTLNSLSNVKYNICQTSSSNLKRPKANVKIL